MNKILTELDQLESADLGCGVCGYASCTDFTTAIAQGLAIPEMCFTYVLTNNESITNRDINHEGKVLNVSIFVIEKDKIVGSVIRDMSAPEAQKEEVVKRLTRIPTFRWSWKCAGPLSSEWPVCWKKSFLKK